MLRLPPLPRASAAGLILVAACGPAPAAPAVAPQAPPPAPVATAEPAPRPPSSVTAGAMPEGAPLYGVISNVPALVKAARAAAGAHAGEIRAFLTEEMGVPEATADRLLDSIASIHLGGKRVGGAEKVAVSVVFADVGPVREVLAGGAFVEVLPAPSPFARRFKAKEGSGTFLWFEGPRLLVTGDEAMVEAITGVVEGRVPGMTELRGVGVGDQPRAFVAIDPSLIDGGGGGPLAGPLTIAYELWEGGIRGAYRTSLAVKDGGLPLPPERPLGIARSLPAETAAYVTLSTGIPGGAKGAERLLSLATAAGGRDVARAVEEIGGVLGRAGASLPEVVGSLGGEGVLGVVVRPGVKSEDDLRKGFAAVWLQDVAEPAPGERLLKLARETLAKVAKTAKIRTEPGGFSGDFPGSVVPYVHARLAKHKLFFALGQRDLVDRALAAADKGRGTLGDDAAHRRVLGALPDRTQARLWIDLSRGAELVAASAARPSPLDLWRGVLAGTPHVESALSFSAAPHGDTVQLSLDEVNGIGIFAALGVFGVRRYLAASKVAEAKNTLAAIARAAVASYERERLGPGNTPVHALCKSAQPVPAAVPRGVRYQPSTQAGADWNSGDENTGWQCLKMALYAPQHYRYTYTVGGPYKGPARGGPDPGPGGFEVAAEGDLDGDGSTSLLTRVGKLDPATGMITLSPLFVDRELD